MARDISKLIPFCLLLVLILPIVSCQEDGDFSDDQGDEPEPEDDVDNANATAGSDDTSEEDSQIESVEPPNVAQLIATMFKNYVRLERPYYRVKPLDMTIRFDVSSISHISEENMEFRATVYFTQVWFDPRLAFDMNKNFSYIIIRGRDIDKIWLPDTYISNARSYVVDPYTPTVKIYGDGMIDYSYRLSITLLSRMNFIYYPMDHQILHIDIYTYSYKFNQVRLTWDRGSILFDEMAAYVVKKIDRIEEIHFDGVEEYSFLSFRVTVRRRLRYFLLQFFFPCILCAFVSWLPFWMDRYETGERMALGITTLLTEVFLSQYINSSMPRVSYIKAADEYLLATFIFIFAALLESVAVYNYRPDVLEKKEQEKNKKNSKKTVKAFVRDNLGCNDCKVSYLDGCDGLEMNFRSENDSSDNQDKKDQNTNADPTTTEARDETTAEHPSRDKSLLIDKVCRILFPLLYLVFQGYYFGRYCPDFYRAYK